MTKAEIVTEIAKQTGIEKAAVLSVVEKLMEVIKDSLADGENVYLRGFGSFTVKKRATKTARNISKNTTLIITEHKIPAFKSAKLFRYEFHLVLHSGYTIEKESVATKHYVLGCVLGEQEPVVQYLSNHYSSLYQ